MYKISDIQSHKVERISTGFIGLDMVLGQNTLVDNDFPWMGMAEGSVILNAGSAGTGKSRLAISVSTNLNRRKEKVMYFQLETSLSHFKNWVNDRIAHPDLYLVSDEVDYKKQIAYAYKHKPKLVIVDSVNRYDVHHSNIKNVIDDLQKCAQNTGAIFWLIGQLDQKASGDTVRGSQDWTYLPDVVAYLKRNIINKSEFMKQQRQMFKEFVYQNNFKYGAQEKNKSDMIISQEYDNLKRRKEHEVVFSIPQKNRFGPSGKSCVLVHTNDGIVEKF